MTPRETAAFEIADLFAALLHPSALFELAVIAACLGSAWLAVHQLKGRKVRAASVLYGRNGVDGVLFPVIALALALIARAVLPRLGVPNAVFRVAVPVLVSLLAIRFTVRVLRAAFPASNAVRAIERTVSWVAWVAVVGWVTGVLPVVMDALGDIRWNFGSTEISARNLVEGTLATILVMVLALWLSASIENHLLKGATAANLSLRKIAANAVRALLLFIGLLFALSTVGIDLTALGVLGGALGVGLGFGLQKVAANYVSGFVILAERSLRIGDMVKVDTFEGRITDIRTRYTVIRSLGGREAIVPNELLITQRVENSSLADPRVAVSSTVQVAYGTDVRRLQGALEAAMRAVPRVLAEPGPSAQLSAFGADGIELTLNFWIGDPENGAGNVKSEVNFAVLALLDAQGIEIPYPQRVVKVIDSRPPPEAAASGEQTAPEPPYRSSRAAS